MKLKFISIISILVILISCNKLPKKKLSQFILKDVGYEVINDSLIVKLSNPLHCPIRINIKTKNKNLQERLNQDFPLVLEHLSSKKISYWTDTSKEQTQIKFLITLGNPNDTISKKSFSLPFKKDYTYKIIQGYNGDFSHSSKYSKYALDFNLKEGDTICAAADGYVVGVIEDYSLGGKSKKWRDYANFITIFHPNMNLYTQYVHLTYKGSMVKVGDFVKFGQAIGLSGKTGLTTTEHLHFNVLKPNKSGMESIPIKFKEGYTGNSLKKGQWIKK